LGYDYNIIISNYFKQYRLDRGLNDIKGMAKALHQIAYLKNHSITVTDSIWRKRCIRLLEKAIELRRKCGYLYGIPNSLFEIGNVYFLSNNFGEAIIYYEQALHEAKEIGNDLVFGRCYNMKALAIINKAIIELDFAKILLEDSIKIKELNSRNESLGSSYNNYSLLLLRLCSYQKAVEYKFKAIKVHSEGDVVLSLNSVLELLNDLYNMKDAVESIDYELLISIANQNIENITDSTLRHEKSKALDEIIKKINE
jgi:tetratricopeptide (TPR) repeat protein